MTGLAPVAGTVSHTGVGESFFDQYCNRFSPHSRFSTRRVGVSSVFFYDRSSVLFRSLTLGGGFGWLCAQHGLVIDNLIQATVVTGSGNILTASVSENEDLFWAIRGGGGNFGVVTEFVYRLHEQRPDLYISSEC
jgi:hypothetical protein